MDPNATIERATQAARNDDKAGYDAAMADYNEWRSRGGFAATDELLAELEAAVFAAFVWQEMTRS